MEKVYIDKKTEIWEEDIWQREIRDLTSLELYPKKELGQREYYINDTEESKILTRLRLNNIQWNWKQGEEKLCKACN